LLECHNSLQGLKMGDELLVHGWRVGQSSQWTQKRFPPSLPFEQSLTEGVNHLLAYKHSQQYEIECKLWVRTLHQS
jgi:hypothetical protein